MDIGIARDEMRKCNTLGTIYYKRLRYWEFLGDIQVAFYVCLNIIILLSMTLSKNHST